MRKGRFTEEQMVGILREADRNLVAQVAKKHGISEQTIYTGVSASAACRLPKQTQVDIRLGYVVEA